MSPFCISSLAIKKYSTPSQGWIQLPLAPLLRAEAPFAQSSASWQVLDSQVQQDLYLGIDVMDSVDVLKTSLALGLQACTGKSMSQQNDAKNLGLSVHYKTAALLRNTTGINYLEAEQLMALGFSWFPWSHCLKPSLQP